MTRQRYVRLDISPEEKKKKKKRAVIMNLGAKRGLEQNTGQKQMQRRQQLPVHNLDYHQNSGLICLE